MTSPDQPVTQPKPIASVSYDTSTKVAIALSRQPTTSSIPNFSPVPFPTYSLPCSVTPRQRVISLPTASPVASSKARRTSWQ